MPAKLIAFVFAALLFFAVLPQKTFADCSTNTPACPAGQQCVSTLRAYTDLGMIGIASDLLSLVGVIPSVCVLPTPTPYPCKTDFDCTPFKCNLTNPSAGFCDNTQAQPTATPAPTAEICSGNSCDTAIGPIPTTPAEFSAKLLAILLSLSGGITLLIIIMSGYQIMTSQGNPEKLQGAKETLTSAIVGLLFIIFSFVLLQIIASDILRIPGFGP